MILKKLISAKDILENIKMFLKVKEDLSPLASQFLASYVKGGLGMLRAQVRSVCSSRGHDMDFWKDGPVLWVQGKSFRSTQSKCKKCGALVFANTCPPPNLVSVVGPAIVTKCQKT